MIVPGVADALHVLADPLGLQGADDGPDVGLLRSAAAGFEGPALRDVGHEVRVLEGVRPNVLECELGPLLDGDVLHLDLLEEALLALDHVLEEAQGRVLEEHEVEALEGEEEGEKTEVLTRLSDM